MSRHSTVLLTIGVAGSGKSYRRCAIEIFNFFRDNPKSGRFISNFPINIDAVCLDLFKKYGKPPEFYKSRIIIIPRKVLSSWMIGIDPNKTEIEPRGLWSYFRSIPWAEWEKDKGETWFSEQTNFYRDDLLDPYQEWIGSQLPDLVYCDEVEGEKFAAIDLQDSHISIDECHNFCSATGSTPKQHRQRWGQFLGEIRHRGATIEFITQAESKLADEIKAEADIKLELINAEKEREYLTGVEMYYFMELVAKFTGVYHTFVFQLEYRKENKRWKLVDNKGEKFFINPKNFKYYNSYAAPFAGAGSVDAPQHEYQKRNFISLIYWIWVNNIYRLTSRIAILLFFIWLVAFGGLGFFIDLIMGGSQNLIAGNVKPSVPVSVDDSESLVIVDDVISSDKFSTRIVTKNNKSVSNSNSNVVVSPPPPPPPPPPEPVYSLVTDLWVVVDGKLYNVVDGNELGIVDVDMEKRTIYFITGKRIHF